MMQATAAAAVTEAWAGSPLFPQLNCHTYILQNMAACATTNRTAMFYVGVNSNFSQMLYKFIPTSN